MKAIAVDDEEIALRGLISSIVKVDAGADIQGFQNPADALKYAKNHDFDIAFLDVEMRNTNGIELAKHLKKKNPMVNIIFTTSYSKYAMDAIHIHASGYILKPITPQKIAEELKHLRHPVAAPASKKRVRVSCFGNFEVWLDGKPVKFQYSKTKEMFAYLIDRHGAMCTNNEIIAVLWEDEYKGSYYRNIRVDLLNSFPENILIKEWGKIGTVPDQIDCDYYDWIKGSPSAINAFKGEYMSQYSWAEVTLSELENI